MNQDWFTRIEQDTIDQTYLDNMVTATKYFIDWWRFQTVPYQDMLIGMHRIVARGYSGYTNTHREKIYVVRSKFRGDVGNVWYPILKKDWYKVTHTAKIIRPRVKHVPPDKSHWLDNEEDGYVLHLPHEKHVRMYVELMEVLMLRLKQGVCLTTLANYMNLFVIGHPFERINYSICMAQINAVLWLNGYEPMLHDYMDFKCFLFDSDIIEKHFISRVKSKG
jgi:hypothetical protein